MQEFALRVRTVLSRTLATQMLLHRVGTEDVVKDAPMPQFRLNLEFLASLLQPQRKLRPKRKKVTHASLYSELRKPVTAKHPFVF